ncbi:MAG: VacJ family lipoprotein [Desulfosudaceae bacterium]
MPISIPAFFIQPVFLLLGVGLMICSAFPAAADPVGELSSSMSPSSMDIIDDSNRKTVSEEPTDDFDDFTEFEEFDEEDEQPAVFDPLGGYNRVMTRINDRLYYLVLKPAARGYSWVVVEPARKSIAHFFTNLGFPIRFINNLLQLKGERAATEVVRFIVNTSIGVAGLWDPATEMMDLPLYNEDFGQTLGHYGLGGGFHIVLPLLGPSNLRDLGGHIADRPLNPLSHIDQSYTELIVRSVKTVNGTSLRLGQYEAMTEDTVDLYIFLREAYRQNRNKQIEE